MPSHHPEQGELLGYAVGSAPLHLATLIACHLTLCPECRSEVAMLETIGAMLLEDVDCSEISTVAGAATANAQRANSSPYESNPRIPSEMQRYLPRPLHPFIRDRHPKFRFRAPGLSELRLTSENLEVPIKLVRFKPGFVIPEHDHGGLEWLMIFSGELRDMSTEQSYRVGDVSRRNVGDVHRQVIGHDEPCVAVFANSAPPIPRNMLGRLLAKIVGL